LILDAFAGKRSNCRVIYRLEGLVILNVENAVQRYNKKSVKPCGCLVISYQLLVIRGGKGTLVGKFGYPVMGESLGDNLKTLT